MEVFSLAVGCGASGRHDEARQGPSGASAELLAEGGVGAHAPTPNARARNKTRQRVPFFTTGPFTTGPGRQ
jgi:hypothetical protein